MIAQIFNDLRREGVEDRLVSLIRHEDPKVVLWAAAHSLAVASEEATTALEALNERRDLVGLAAEQTLTEWRAGRLTFP